MHKTFFGVIANNLPMSSNKKASLPVEIKKIWHNVIFIATIKLAKTDLDSLFS